MLTIDLRRLALRRGACALDLGCGRGRHAHALALSPGVTVVGLDADGEDVTAARNGLRLFGLNARGGMLQGDALRLPFPPSSFDAVICSEVLEHIHDVDGALDEIARVTRAGGVFALSVPRAWPERICWRLSEAYRTTPGGHVRIFNAGALLESVRARGFMFLARHGAHALHSPYWWLRCAVTGDPDRHTAVRLYKRVLEWEIRTHSRALRTLEATLNPVLGKSVVMYFRRAGSAA